MILRSIFDMEVRNMIFRSIFDMKVSNMILMSKFDIEVIVLNRIWFWYGLDLKFNFEEFESYNTIRISKM